MWTDSFSRVVTRYDWLSRSVSVKHCVIDLKIACQLCSQDGPRAFEAPRTRGSSEGADVTTAFVS